MRGFFISFYTHNVLNEVCSVLFIVHFNGVKMTEQSFWGKVADIIARAPVLILMCIFAYTFSLASQIPKLKVDLGLDVLYDEKDPGLLKLKQVHKLFGNDQIATILIEVDDMFSVENLKKLEKPIKRLREVPFALASHHARKIASGK